MNFGFTTVVLEDVGISVVTADNGQAANDCLQNQDFDLVLMDIQMPVMDGYTATSKIREQRHFDKLPVLAMTQRLILSISLWWWIRVSSAIPG